MGFTQKVRSVNSDEPLWNSCATWSDPPWSWWLHPKGTTAFNFYGILYQTLFSLNHISFLFPICVFCLKVFDYAWENDIPRNGHKQILFQPSTHLSRKSFSHAQTNASSAKHIPWKGFKKCSSKEGHETRKCLMSLNIVKYKENYQTHLYEYKSLIQRKRRIW